MISDIQFPNVDNCPLPNCPLLIRFVCMEIKAVFGNKIKILRLEKNISQEELAHIAGIDRTYISDIEKGERNVSLLIIQKLAKALDKEIFELFK